MPSEENTVDDGDSDNASHSSLNILYNSSIKHSLARYNGHRLCFLLSFFSPRKESFKML